MKKHILGFLILSSLFSVVLSGPYGSNVYIRELLNWFKARDYCRKHHTDLSSIYSTEQENKLLQSRDSGYPNVWTGLYQTDSGVWKWSGGKPVSVHIAPTTDENRCVIHNSNGWHRQHCTTATFRFFCFQSKMVLVKENKTWEEAMKHCHSLSKHLVTLPSESGLTKFMQTCREAQTDHVWTGMRFLAGRWLWEDGKDVKYTAWSPGETPQCSERVRRCGALSLEGQHWVSQDCANKFNFACY